MRPTLLLAFAVLLSTAPAAEVEGDPKGSLIVRLDGDLPLKPRAMLFDDGGMSLHTATMRLREALKAPEATIVLDLSSDFDAGTAACEELAAILREPHPGKKVVCLIDESRDAAMAVAAACDEVVMPPAGMLAVAGLDLSTWYVADGLAKLGVRFHAVQSGAWKSAPEMFTRNAPSEAAKQEHQELAAALAQVQDGLLTRGTKVTVAGLAAARAQAPQTSAIALKTGLVDRLAEPGEFRAALPQPVRELDGKKKMPDLSNFAGVMAFWSQLLEGERSAKAEKAVAVVELEGEIVDGDGSEPGESIAGIDTAELLDRLADDKHIVAVVLRINSPGGSASASDRIHHAVRRLDAKKPVVALFDAVAASGGYYIGCGAREVLVHRATITGSIGVFALMPDLTGTAGLIGLNRFPVTTAPRADLHPFAPWSADKDAALRQVVEDTDRRFQAIVAANRKLDAAVVMDLAGGKVYTGTQAVERKLADGYGTLISAVARARALAKEPNPLPLERLPKRSGLAAKLGLAQSFLPTPLVGPARSLNRWAQVALRGRPLILTWAQVPR